MAYTQAFIDEQQSTGGRVFTLIEIVFGNPAIEIDLVDNIEDVVFGSKTYIATALSVTLPTQQGIPTSTLTLDGVGSTLGQIIDDNNGLDDAVVTLKQVMMSDTNVEQFSITLNLTNIVVTHNSILGKLGFDEIFNTPAFDKYYDSTTAPALV